MKIFLALCALIYLTNPLATCAAPPADEPTAGWGGTAGVGPIIFPKYIGSKSTQAFPIPILSINYDETFYVELERMGVYIVASDDKKTGLGLAVEPRFGYSAKDGARLLGMSKRRDSLEGGVTFDRDFDIVAFSVAYFRDLAHSSSGNSLRASVYKPLVKQGRWDIGALLAFDIMSDRVTNYYFGVRPTEATQKRPSYQPGHATSPAVGLSGNYKFDKQYAFMFGVISTHLPGSVAASPIVETRRASTWYLGCGWNL